MRASRIVLLSIAFLPFVASAEAQLYVQGDTVCGTHDQSLDPPAWSRSTLDGTYAAGELDAVSITTSFDLDDDGAAESQCAFTARTRARYTLVQAGSSASISTAAYGPVTSIAQTAAEAHDSLIVDSSALRRGQAFELTLVSVVSWRVTGVENDDNTTPFAWSHSRASFGFLDTPRHLCFQHDLPNGCTAEIDARRGTRTYTRRLRLRAGAEPVSLPIFAHVEAVADVFVRSVQPDARSQRNAGEESPFMSIATHVKVPSGIVLTSESGTEYDCPSSIAACN